MRYYITGSLLISRYTKTTSAIFSMYHILGLLDKPSIMVYSPEVKKLVTLNKKPSEIICLDFDFVELETAFYKWYYTSNKIQKPNKPFLFLNEEQSKLFLKSIETAVYYFNIQKYNCISENQFEELKDLYDTIIPEQIVN
jgi:hypothetical protein